MALRSSQVITSGKARPHQAHVWDVLELPVNSSAKYVCGPTVGIVTLILSDEERSELKALAARRKTAQALALRAWIALISAAGSHLTPTSASWLN